MVIMSSWVAYETFDDQKNRVNKSLAQAATRIDAALSQEIAHAGHLLDGIGHQLIKYSKDPYRILNLFQSYQRYRLENRTLLSWINAEQKLVVSNDYGIADAQIDVSDRDYIKRAISKPWQLIIGRPIKGRVSKRWVLPLSLGITDNEGSFLGVLFMGIDIPHMQQVANVATGNHLIDFSITNRALTSLVTTYEDPRTFKRYFDLSELSKLDFSSPFSQHYSAAKLWDSKTIYAYFQTSPTHPFIYFLTYNRAESVSELKNILTARIFQLVAVGGFLLFVLWTVRKRIIQPVIALSGRTKDATLGNAFETVAYHGPQEIQALNREIYKFWLYTQERKRIEAELRHKLAELMRIRDASVLTNKVKAEFFTLAEEILRTPTQSILEQSETIKEQHFGPITSPKYLKNAGEIHKNARDILKILSDMSKIADAESGIIQLQENHIDLTQLLRKSLQLFNESSPKLLQLQVDNSTPLPNIIGDKQRLRQLCLHLFTVVASQTGTGDVLRVSSNIRAGHMNLFFSFAHSTQNSHASATAGDMLGTNMAFALARLLAAMHQGSLEIKTTPDKITTLTLKIPTTRVKGK